MDLEPTRFMSRRLQCVIVTLVEPNFQLLQPKDSSILVEIILCPHQVKAQGAHPFLTIFEAAAHLLQGLLANLVRVEEVQAILDLQHDLASYKGGGIKLIVLNEKAGSMNEYSVVSFPTENVASKRR